MPTFWSSFTMVRKYHEGNSDTFFFQRITEPHEILYISISDTVEEDDVIENLVGFIKVHMYFGGFQYFWLVRGIKR